MRQATLHARRCTNAALWRAGRADSGSSMDEPMLRTNRGHAPGSGGIALGGARFYVVRAQTQTGS